MATEVVVALIALAGILLPAWWQIVRKLNIIHVQTNSNLTKANDRLDEALAKISELRDVIAELRKSKLNES